MGNDINKVLPGLYIGGILGERPIAAIVGGAECNVHLLNREGTNRQQLLSEKKITHVLSILDSRIEERVREISVKRLVLDRRISFLLYR